MQGCRPTRQDCQVRLPGKAAKQGCWARLQYAENWTIMFVLIEINIILLFLRRKLMKMQKWDGFYPELFGPGHFVRLGLRLKSEIRTRART
jgi:hypothetical protein